MRLDWNDVKARAAKFTEEWKGARYERGETQTFNNEFFEVFGITRLRMQSRGVVPLQPDFHGWTRSPMTR